jgi:acyl-coenzyme A thioesterase PaaI-like protein
MLRRALNLYPPYIGAGVSVVHVADDWSSMTVKLTLRWYNRNYVGTHFGGNLFTMTDPFYMLMLMHRLGPAYNVWDQKAEITFIKPGKGSVVAHMSVTEEEVEAIRQASADGAKHFAKFDVDIVDADDDVVATVHKTLYVREKPPKVQ